MSNFKLFNDFLIVIFLSGHKTVLYSVLAIFYRKTQYWSVHIELILIYLFNFYILSLAVCSNSIIVLLFLKSSGFT